MDLLKGNFKYVLQQSGKSTTIVHPLLNVQVSFKKKKKLPAKTRQKDAAKVKENMTSVLFLR